MRLYLAGLILFALAGACGSDSGTAPDAGTSPRSLAILSESQLGLSFGQRSTITVRLTEQGGARPVAGAPVSFTIVTSFPGESAAGAILSTASATTDDDGRATVDIVAGAANATFRVTAAADTASPVTVRVMVSDGGFADLVVHPKHVGPRSATGLGSIEVRVYAAGIGCPALSPDTPPSSIYEPRVIDDGATTTFAKLPANEGLTVIGFARASDGETSAAGCVDLVPGQLRPGTTPLMALPIADRPLSLSPRYHITSTIDLVPVRDIVIGPGSPWAVLACPGGAAQLVLDCAIDLLDGGDPDDCQVAVPGALAAKLQAARAAADASGCRRGGATIDGQVMALLTARSGSPASQLAAASTQLSDLLDVVSLDATLVIDGVVADLALGTLGAEVSGARFQVNLPSSSRPLIAAPMVVGLADDALTLGPAQLSLRLGSFVADTFASETGLGAGSELTAGLLGEGGAACADISASACVAVDEPSDCLEAACLDARALVARVLDGPFTALSVPGADITLDGSVLVDGDGVGLAGVGLSNGLWRGTMHLSTNGEPLVSGVFGGQVQNL